MVDNKAACVTAQEHWQAASSRRARPPLCNSQRLARCARLDSALSSRDAYWGSLSLAAGLGAVQRERGVICQPFFLPA